MAVDERLIRQPHSAIHDPDTCGPDLREQRLKLPSDSGGYHARTALASGVTQTATTVPCSRHSRTRSRSACAGGLSARIACIGG